MCHGRDGDDEGDGVVSAGSSVVVTETFVVNDTGMTVGAGTVCDVIQGNEAAGNIHVRFSHPQPPWVVLVSRLYAMSAELQVRVCFFLLLVICFLWCWCLAFRGDTAVGGLVCLVDGTRVHDARCIWVPRPVSRQRVNRSATEPPPALSLVHSV